MKLFFAIQDKVVLCLSTVLWRHTGY